MIRERLCGEYAMHFIKLMYDLEDLTLVPPRTNRKDLTVDTDAGIV
jgi:hypothetical protein